jgi:predicted permease
MLSGLIARLRSVWRVLRRPQSVDAEMQEEFRLHIELRTRDLVRSGLAPEEAGRIARVEFGKTDHRRQEGRRARGLGLFDELRFSWLDLRLGARMLVRHPGLSVVGGLGIAVVIALSTTSFAVASALFSGLPFDEADRIVAIDYLDTRWNDEERRIVHDFEAWRDELRSIVQLGAERTVQHNLITSDGRAEPVRIAEMSASGFRVARVPALLGRPLLESDETDGAPPVVVIAHDAWRTRFGADPAIVGREIRLGNTVRTVVGVMPEGFGFPVFHQYWTTLRLDASDYQRRKGPAIRVFGRLADDASIAQAQAELTAYGRRMAAEFPRTHEHLRARVMPYQDAFNPSDELAALGLVQFLVIVLVGVVCTNVATLVYARTASRHSEIAVRSALGASRPRIVGHLFAEGLVLSSASAALGLALARVALDQTNAILVGLDTALPFWMKFRMSPGTWIYAMAVAGLAAMIVGVIPALKATGKHVNASLQRLSSGATRLQLGRTWTALIVAQAGFAVAVAPFAVHQTRLFIQYGTAQPGFLSKDFLTFRLRMDRDVPATADTGSYDREYSARFVTRQRELLQRLGAEPGVGHRIQLASIPGNAPRANVEVEGGLTSVVGTARIDVGHFAAFGVPIASGRSFSAGDAGVAVGGQWRDGDGDGVAEYRAGDAVSTSTAVMVNRSFVTDVLGGTEAPGRRLRYTGRMDDGQSAARMQWYEIVGVVNDFPAKPMEPDAPRAMIYHPLAEGELTDLMAIRLSGVPPSLFGERLREIAATVDPSLRVHDIRPFDVAVREEHLAMRMAALGIALVTASVLLVSGAGIYALMSFTVARRRREIGIRMALGADRGRVIRGIFARAFGQLMIGVGGGVIFAPILLRLDGPFTPGKVVILLCVSGAVVLVGLLASVGPTRRTLRIQPTEALKEG